MLRPEHWAQQINPTDQPFYHQSTPTENQSTIIVPLPLQIQPLMNLNETSKTLLGKLLTTTNQKDPITILFVSKKLQLSSYSWTLASFTFSAPKIQDSSHRSTWNGRGARGAQWVSPEVQKQGGPDLLTTTKKSKWAQSLPNLGHRWGRRKAKEIRENDREILGLLRGERKV